MSAEIHTMQPFHKSVNQYSTVLITLPTFTILPPHKIVN